MLFNLDDYSKLLGRVVAATTPAEKGSSLETVCEYLFSVLRGVEVTERDIQLTAEEIDLVLWNAQVEDELRPLDPVILLECKNWSVPAGANELEVFVGKLRRRSLKCGIFVASNGVTGSFDSNGERGARGIVAHALQEGIRVLVLTLDDLSLISSESDLRNLIKRRFCGIFVRKLFG